MFEKMLLTLGVLVLGLSTQADSQYDPLSIDPLMRPLDPEHTWEYLDMGGGGYVSPYAVPAADLRGNWNLDLRDGTMKQLTLTLLQNREVIFGRGILSLSGMNQTAFSSGETYRDVLYLDVLSGDLVLYRCTLTVSEDHLSGSYYAFDSQGRVWSGIATGRRSA